MSKLQLSPAKLFGGILVIFTLTGCHINSVKDIDGNYYKTVRIGVNLWMAENLKTTRLNDGTQIPMIAYNEEWLKLKGPAYSWYNNDSTENKKTYGALYNWYAVNSKKLCPVGWQVPSDQEWERIAINLRGFSVSGGKMKEAGTAHWKSPNTGATNESGFTALPGGYRSIGGAFNYINVSGYWWSSSESDSTTAMFWNMRYKFSDLYNYRGEKVCGFSVRCVKER